jgi:electron transport complex protein RnfC
VPPQAQVHTLVVNGCECEPYLTCDHRVMLEEAPALLSRHARLAMRATGAVRTIIGVEDNKPDAVAAVQAAIDDSRRQATSSSRPCPPSTRRALRRC